MARSVDEASLQSGSTSGMWDKAAAKANALYFTSLDWVVGDTLPEGVLRHVQVSI